MKKSDVKQGLIVCVVTEKILYSCGATRMSVGTIINIIKCHKYGDVLFFRNIESEKINDDEYMNEVELSKLRIANESEIELYKQGVKKLEYAN